VGNIKEFDKMYGSAVFFQHMAYNPYNEPTICQRCAYLPICGSECPSQRVNPFATHAAETECEIKKIQWQNNIERKIDDMQSSNEMNQ
ncbi:MAG: SPASM domain-containing protein, partial [Candidatus Cloacimonetes bacterium]|nr:SPASM domain-containing protein [Candidatus Cloacimonadota bacterium]